LNFEEKTCVLVRMKIRKEIKNMGGKKNGVEEESWWCG